MTLNDITLSQAVEISLDNASAAPLKENVYINEALQRVLASDIYAKINSPAFKNSAMDGFAFKHSANRQFKVIKTIYAGDKYEDFDIKDDECVRIMTGAKVPEHCDTVIPIEKCLEVTGEYIKIPEIKKGSNVRLKGEEFEKGEILIKKGTAITPEIVAAMASQGIVSAEVYVKPKIAILSTGNELKEPWENADEDEIYNVNSHAIKALLNKYGFEADIIGIIPDSFEKTVSYISTLKTKYDVIVTSGGISFGDADFLYAAYKKNGLNPFFHGIMLKPGRPTMVGKMDDTMVFALPGNPLSSYLNAFLILIPTLRKLSGAENFRHLEIIAVNKSEFKTNPKKDHIILGNYKNGEWEVFKNYKYSSGMVSALINSNSVMIWPKGKNTVQKGEKVTVVLL